MAVVASESPSGSSPGHRLLLPAAQVDVGAAGPERVGEPGHLRREPGVGEGLIHQPGQLVTLAG